MKSKQKGFTVVELFIVVIWLVVIIGYIANIIKMTLHINEAMTGLEAIRMIGVLVPPLGSILGYL